MDITDEMLYAATCAYEARDEYAGEQYAHDGIRAGLAAVAPLIAAQALRQAAEEIESGITENPTELEKRHPAHLDRVIAVHIRGGCSACRPGTGCNA